MLDPVSFRVGRVMGGLFTGWPVRLYAGLSSLALMRVNLATRLSGFVVTVIDTVIIIIIIIIIIITRESN